MLYGTSCIRDSLFILQLKHYFLQLFHILQSIFAFGKVSQYSLLFLDVVSWKKFKYLQQKVNVEWLKTEGKRGVLKSAAFLAQ